MREELRESAKRVLRGGAGEDGDDRETMPKDRDSKDFFPLPVAPPAFFPWNESEW